MIQILTTADIESSLAILEYLKMVVHRLNLSKPIFHFKESSCHFTSAASNMEDMDDTEEIVLSP
jgi:hypothetical protein